MRLIDAEHLKRWIIARWEKTAPRSEYPLRAIDIIDQIDREDTIDAVPVKHGEWIDDEGLYRCSSCNHLWSELWWTENCPIERMLKIMPYCPNCGAKMNGGEDNE